MEKIIPIYNQNITKIYDKTLKVVDSRKLENFQIDTKSDSYQKNDSEVIYESQEGKVKRLIKKQ